MTIYSGYSRESCLCFCPLQQVFDTVRVTQRNVCDKYLGFAEIDTVSSSALSVSRQINFDRFTFNWDGVNFAREISSP